MAAVPARLTGTVARARALYLLVGMATLTGCLQTGRPPVLDRSPVFGAVPDSYTVRKGDTLYSIAWRFELDHRALARANRIEVPYTIYVGQRIRLTAPASAAPAPAPSPRPVPPAPAATTTNWQHPTAAAVERGYGRGNRGIDYRLARSHSVHAAAPGEVVYAGSGLGGFRHLVIVKHDPTYLSAYSLDRAIAVQEGQRIKAGELLADKEDGGRRVGTLHFEIRKDGAPVDPRSLIGRER